MIGDENMPKNDNYFYVKRNGMISRIKNYNDLVNYLSAWNSVFGNSFFDRVKRFPGDMMDETVRDYNYKTGETTVTLVRKSRDFEILDSHKRNFYSLKLEKD